MAGQTDFACTVLIIVASQVQAGTVKALPITGRDTSDVIRGVPTTKEAGLPQFHPITWKAGFGPKNLPTDIQAKLSDALDRALDDADARKRLKFRDIVAPGNLTRFYLAADSALLVPQLRHSIVG